MGARVDISHGGVSLAAPGMAMSSTGATIGSSMGEPPPPRHDAVGLPSGSYARRRSDVFAEQRPEVSRQGLHRWATACPL